PVTVAAGPTRRLQQTSTSSPEAASGEPAVPEVGVAVPEPAPVASVVAVVAENSATWAQALPLPVTAGPASPPVATLSMMQHAALPRSELVGVLQPLVVVV